MTTEDDILIDNYLKGLLSKNEIQAFVERLEVDREFSEYFELEKQLFDALDEKSWSFVESRTAEVSDYKSILEEDSFKKLKTALADTNSKFNTKRTVGNMRLFYYLAAASIVIFLGTQFFFNQKKSNQDLYNDYVALSDLPSFVSRGDGSEDLVRAQRLFENKEYEAALLIFKSQLNQSEKKGIRYIYQGIAETELRKFDDAERTFNALLNSNLLDAERGYWYKALLFVKSNNIKEAKKLLLRIKSQSLYNSTIANDLLEKLND